MLPRSSHVQTHTPRCPQRHCFMEKQHRALCQTCSKKPNLHNPSCVFNCLRKRVDVSGALLCFYFCWEVWLESQGNKLQHLRLSLDLTSSSVRRPAALGGALVLGTGPAREPALFGAGLGTRSSRFINAIHRDSPGHQRPGHSLYSCNRDASDTSRYQALEIMEQLCSRDAQADEE